jgi:hypothetical protein
MASDATNRDAPIIEGASQRSISDLLKLNLSFSNCGSGVLTTAPCSVQIHKDSAGQC